MLKDVWRNPKQRMALMFSGLILMGHFLIIPFVNPYLELNKGYSKAHTPMIYLAGGVTTFFAANILGRLSDKHGKLKVFSICILLFLSVVVLLTNLPAIPFYTVLMLFALWFALSTGRGVTAQPMISNIVNPQKRGSSMSFNSSIQQLGTSATSLIAGLIVLKGPKGEIYRYDWLGYLSCYPSYLCCTWLSCFR